MFARAVSLAFVVLSTLLLVSCVTKPTPEPTLSPTIAFATATAFSGLTSTPAVAGPTVTAVVTTPTIRPTVAPTATPTKSGITLPGGVSLPVLDVEDCMAGCHPPDPNEFYDAGAVIQPADHKGRTTCLNCHAAPDRKPLPATHLGRLDPACAGCHKPPK